MKELKIYEFQAKHIEDTLRLVANRLNSKDRKTSLDRDIMQAFGMIENVLNEKITEQVNRYK
jgi:hypothetical protein